jgi:hypothetical protein|tara:strand:+ start:296 stop:823 length:528 start_codon:yes stop_codon:yes gene_type:complete
VTALLLKGSTPLVTLANTVLSSVTNTSQTRCFISQLVTVCPYIAQYVKTTGTDFFLSKKVPAGSFVIEYVGEIIDDKTTESRLWADKAVGEDNFYLMEVSGRQMIDARHKGNLSRFINSSCHPNCETQKWQDASTGETRVGIFAIQDVEIGAEFTYDYNFAHFGYVFPNNHIPPP